MVKRGQSTPMERHGEIGRLYTPVTQLTIEEHVLHGEVFRIAHALPEIDDTRDGFRRFLQTAADRTITDPVARKAMVEHVMAYMDELAMLDAQGPH